MVEIKFKPNLKIEYVFLLTGSILLLTIILSPIGILMIIGTITSIITKSFRTYIINDNNEIENNYEFLSKTSFIYRADQITSLTLSQGFFEKKFNLGSIHFGIFGKNNEFEDINSQNNSQNQYMRQGFLTIKEYNEIFSKLNEMIGLKPEMPVYEDKPSTKPIKFWTFIWLSLFLISTIATFFLNFQNYSLFYFLDVLFFIFFIFSFWSYLITKSTKYSIANNYIKYEYNYFLGSKIEIVPLDRITNYEIEKNIISYFIFKVGDVKIYTGGSNDPLFDSLENFEKFKDVLDNLIQQRKGNLNNKKTIKVENKTTNVQIQNKTEVLYETSPGIAFIITPGNLIFFIFSVLSVIFIPIYLINLINKIILWKRTTYKFYKDRVVVLTGVINVIKKEIFI
jgi:uncharacterized membrane protein YdbT with pleckstrin-like domain